MNPERERNTEHSPESRQSINDAAENEVKLEHMSLEQKSEQSSAELSQDLSRLRYELKKLERDRSMGALH